MAIFDPGSGPTAFPAERWALALAAMYPIVNWEGHKTFETIPFNRLDAIKHLHSATAARNMLKRDWSVGGLLPGKRRKSAIKALDWLAYEGHRAPFQYEIDLISGDELLYLAWDLARLVYLSQVCFAAGYVGATEAWHYASTAARLAQKNFQSWRHFGECYLAGRNIWNKGTDNRIDRAIHWLTDNDKSPWEALPWELSLESLKEYTRRDLTLFLLSDAFNALVGAFGFSRLRPLAFFRRDDARGYQERLSIGVHVNDDGQLELHLGVGVRFDDVEALMWPHRTSRLAATLGVDLGRWCEPGTATSWTLGSAEDLPKCRQEMQQAIERYALPYFASLSTVEKMLHELRGPNAEHLCRWNPEIRSIIAACTDALLGNQDSARSLLRASSAGTRDKNLKSYIEKLDERIAAWPAASSG